MSLPAGLSSTYWRTWQHTGSVQEGLQEGEEWIGSWTNVGLYKENDKVSDYQMLTVHLTTHRLILVPVSSTEPFTAVARQAPQPGLSMSLRYVRQTESYNGFMRSSPKITLTLGQPEASSSSAASGSAAAAATVDVTDRQGWTCGVCGFSNSTPAGIGKCGLCGVPWSVSEAAMANASQGPSRSSTPRPTSVPPASPPAVTAAAPAATPATTSAVPAEIACPACTFLNHPSMRNCEICGTPLRKPPLSASAAGPSTSASNTTEVIRLSFRSGGGADKVAYQKLKSVLTQKAWEARPPAAPADDASRNRSRGGIDGIMSSLSLEARAKDDQVKDSFRDLEVLMVRAGEMVRLAQSLDQRLASAPQSGTAEQEPEAASLIRSSLVQLGLPTPALTPDMVSNQRLYHQGLARELQHLLVGSTDRRGGQGGGGGGGGGLMYGPNSRGVIALDEVWGLWMRARGVALLPPSTLIATLPYLAGPTSAASVPIRELTLPSGLKVVHTPQYDPSAFLARLIDRLSPDSDMIEADVNSEPADERGVAHEMGEPTGVVEKSLSLVQIAAFENLPIGLTSEWLDHASLNVRLDRPFGVSNVVKDEQDPGGGVRWYRDLISAWN